jgi:hypothetical protein
VFVRTSEHMDRLMSDVQVGCPPAMTERRTAAGRRF